MPPFCKKCGKSIFDANGLCSECRRNSFYFKKAYSVCLYEGIIKDCIHKFKYGGNLKLASDLSKIMIDFANKYLEINTFDTVIPVPLSNTRQRQRQFNQADILAKSLARYFNFPLCSYNLIKTKNTSSQTGLPKTERVKNLKEAFKVKRADLIQNKNILLIDDVFTTGATVNECSKTLAEAGAKEVYVLTLSRGS